MSITPGIYNNLAESTYHGDRDSLSVSGAKMLLPPSCPAKYRWVQDNPRPPKSEFDFGHAAHMEALGAGPEVVVIEGDWRTKAAKEAVEQARAEGKVPLHAGEAERVKGMAAALAAHPVAPMLFANGKPEQSVFWTDERTGITRRARFDWLPGVETSSGRLLLTDYKTARSAEPGEWSRSVANFGYFMQADWYMEACRAAGVHDNPAFTFVVQEKEPPYVVQVYTLDSEALRIGRAFNNRALDIYAECATTDRWPGYSDDVQTVALPGWFTYQAEEYLA